MKMKKIILVGICALVLVLLVGGALKMAKMRNYLNIKTYNSYETYNLK